MYYSDNPDNPLQYFAGLVPRIPTSSSQPAVPILPQNIIIPKPIINTPLVPQLVLSKPITTPMIPQNRPLVTKPIVPQVTKPILLQTKPITTPMIPQQVTKPIVPQVTKPIVPQNRSIGNDIRNQKQWLNLKGQVFEELPVRWYNIRTSRFVSNKPGTYSPVYGLRSIRILGTRDDLNSFWRLNSEKIKHRFPTVTTIEDIIFEPFEDIVFLSEDAAERTQVCFIGTAGTVIAATTTTDVASLTEKQMESMCKFTFGGLFVKGKIDNVIDGDTFYMVFYVPIALLGQGRALGDTKLQAPIIPMEGYHQTGFFAKVSIRMYGYDAAERDTEPGKLAKRLMEQKLQSLGGIVWCQFIEATIADDKYGRTLAVLYEDEQKQRLLNNYLLEQEKIYNIKMVFPYLGGTKKQF